MLETPITSFTDKYEFLNNGYEVPVLYNNIQYRNSEAAFQAQKTTDLAVQARFMFLKADKAKRLGNDRNTIKLRSDWDVIKATVMQEVCRAKFVQNTKLMSALLATGDIPLIYMNIHKDTYWGVYENKGDNVLGNILMQLRSEFRQNTVFNAEYIHKDLVNWIKTYFEETATVDTKAVVGISGGKDSTVVAALCTEALGKDRVIGVLMPQGEQADISDSYKVVETLGIQSIVANIDLSVTAVLTSISQGLSNCNAEISKNTLINLPPRIRMSTLFAVAQSVNGRVANTCNLSEDWLGYSTLFGDSAGQFSPLADLTVTEVIALGDYMHLSFDLVHKIPSDGLCGKTDEDNFGFTYAVLDKYLRTGIIEDTEIKEKIDKRHLANIFKLKPMPKFENNLFILADE